LTDFLGVVPPIAYHGIRAMPWASSSVLQLWDRFNQRECLPGIIAVGTGELHDQWHASAIYTTPRKPTPERRKMPSVTKCLDQSHCTNVWAVESLRWEGLSFSGRLNQSLAVNQPVSLSEGVVPYLRTSDRHSTIQDTSTMPTLFARHIDFVCSGP